VAALPRELIGSARGLTSSVRVYRAPDAIEVEESEGVDVRRRRILLDEVLMVTQHRERGVAFVISMTALAFLFSVLALIVRTNSPDAALGVFAVLALPFLIALIWRLAFGVDVVTVFGRRSRVALRYSPVRGRGPDIYRRLCRLALQAQRSPPRRTAAATPPVS